MTNKFIQEINSGSRTGSLKKEILCFYINNGEASLADLGKDMNLSIPTITKLVSELIEDGYVDDFGKQETAGGRRPNIYGLNHNSGYFVGVDIDHSELNIGIINFNGSLIASKMHIPYKAVGSVEKFDELCNHVINFLDTCGIPRKKIMKIGINLTGRVNPYTGLSYSLFFLEERPLTEIFEERFGIPTTIDNDTRAIAYGEYLTGCTKGEKSVVYINVGWGIATGLIIDGNLYYGKSGFSGEFGHNPTFDNEILCHCGKKGCLETEASGSYVYKQFLEKLDNGEISILSKKHDKGEQISLKDIVDAAISDDTMAIELIEEVGATLGKATAGLINIFNPELVIIGGLMAQAGDYFLLPLQSSIKKFSLNLVSSDSTIRLSKLGDKAGILGACLLARSKTVGLIRMN